MLSLWQKVLLAIEYRNQIIQARKATIDVGKENPQSLNSDLKELREKWPQIIQESCLVVDAMKFLNNSPLHVKARELYSLRGEREMMKMSLSERCVLLF